MCLVKESPAILLDCDLERLKWTTETSLIFWIWKSFSYFMANTIVKYVDKCLFLFQFLLLYFYIIIIIGNFYIYIITLGVCNTSNFLFTS